MTTKQAVTANGRCRLEQLPPRYRSLYENGKADEGAAVFVRPGHSLLFYAVLTIALLGLGGFFTAALVSGGPIFPLEPGASIAGPIIIGLLCLASLGAGFWFLAQLIRAIGRQRRDNAEGYHYGLRLDNDALVVRYHSRKNQDTSLFLPRQRIQDVKVRRETVLRSRGGVNRKSMVAYFIKLEDSEGNIYTIPGKYLNPTERQREQLKMPVIHQADERAAAITAALIATWLQNGIGS